MIYLLFFLIFLVSFSSLSAETFRVSKVKVLNLTNSNSELTAKLGINESLAIYLPEDKLDIEFDGSGHRMSISLGSITEEEFNSLIIEKTEEKIEEIKKIINELEKIGITKEEIIKRINE